MLFFLNEETLSKEERNKLDNNQFGLPNTREYPINDLPHTLQAIRMFKYCSKDNRKELADNILKALEKYQYLDIYLNQNDNSKFIIYCKREKLLENYSNFKIC